MSCFESATTFLISLNVCDMNFYAVPYYEIHAIICVKKLFFWLIFSVLEIQLFLWHFDQLVKMTVKSLIRRFECFQVVLDGSQYNNIGIFLFALDNPFGTSLGLSFIYNAILSPKIKYFKILIKNFGFRYWEIWSKMEFLCTFC